MRPTRFAVVAAVIALVPSTAVACLWDYDTIKMERTRFPTALELITGKFLRHSKEFYEWRVGDRLKKLEADPTNAAYLDDLAVAYDKTGRHEQAIETMLRQEKANPGRYETAANLGTFYFHAGKLREGLPHIDRALSINPDAHFGREKYQKLLVEYVLRQRDGGALDLPLGPDDGVSRNSFSHFLAARLQASDPNAEFDPERPAAIKGVLGMMKFGNHRSPVLLEAIGNLLAGPYTNPTEDAKLLAARAYLKASYEVSDGPAREGYRKMAKDALMMQTPRRDQMGQITLEQVEADFRQELAEAEVWYADLREKELGWIRNGKDPEAEFDKLYDGEPEVSGMDVKDPMSAHTRMEILLRVGIVVTAIVLLGGVATLAYLVYRRARHGRRRASGDAVTRPPS